MGRFGVPTPEQLGKINKLAKRALTADEVFAFSGKSAGDMMIPNRYTRLSPELLKVMEDDAQKGVSFMLNHSWSNWGGVQAIPYGKVFDGRVEPSNVEGEAVSLILDKYIFRDDEIVDGVSANSLIKRIETGVLSDTSIGFSTDAMICSICAENYYGGKCRHFKGIKYEMGDGTQKVCTVTAMPPSTIIPYNNNALYEESIVWDGAYPGAIVTQAKHGDIIEKPSGKFSIVQDKEELPDNTLFYAYYHNGDILTMVKKSDLKKVHPLGGIPNMNETSDEPHLGNGTMGVSSDSSMKGGESKMNEKVLKMLEAFGVTYKEGESKVEEILEQLAEKYSSIPQVEPMDGEVVSYMTQEQVKEKLGKDMAADDVLKLAKEGQEHHENLVNDAMAMGVRAMGNDFAAETWKATLSGMGNQAIKDIMKNWESQAKAIPSGRHTDPSAGLTSFGKAASIPDEAYSVGR